jgi:hypothetical protein
VSAGLSASLRQYQNNENMAMMKSSSGKNAKYSVSACLARRVHFKGENGRE